MIIRTVHDKNNPYFQLNRAAVNDERLSYKAVGIHSYLMSKPDGWEANETDIVNRHTEGRDSVRSGLKELAEYGYLHRTRVTDERGRVVEWRIDVYETPDVNPYFAANIHDDEQSESQSQITDSPQLENQERGEPDYWKPTLWKSQNVENPTHSNNRYIENNELRGKGAQAETPKPEQAPPHSVPASIAPSSNGFENLLSTAKNRNNGDYGKRQAQTHIDGLQAKLKKFSIDRSQFTAMVNDHLSAKGTKELADGDGDAADRELRMAQQFVLDLCSVGKRFWVRNGVCMVWDSWQANDKRKNPSEQQLLQHASQMVAGKVQTPSVSNGVAKPSGVFVGRVENLK